MRPIHLLPLISLGLGGCVVQTPTPVPATTTYVTPAPAPAPVVVARPTAAVITP